MGRYKSNRNNKTQKPNKEIRKMRFYYSSFTIILVICLIQLGYSALYNVLKVIAYKSKIMTLERTLKEAEIHKKDLSEKNNLYSTSRSYEDIARNDLKMAGPNEILVRINYNDEETDGDKKNVE